MNEIVREIIKEANECLEHAKMYAMLENKMMQQVYLQSACNLYKIIAPSNPRYYIVLASISHFLNNESDMQKYLKLAIEHDSDNPRVKALRERYDI